MPPTSSIDSDEDHAARVAAAILIQHLWRKKFNSFPDKHSLHPEIRWQEATTQAQFAVRHHSVFCIQFLTYRTKPKVDRAAAYHGKNSPRERWKRAAFLVGRLLDADSALKTPGVHQVDAEQKHLETQHWLELVDEKHRYGSNWFNYLVEIDDNGKLFWVKNNQPVDTTAGLWVDAGDGMGVVPQDLPEPPLKEYRTTISTMPSASRQSKEAVHYVDQVVGGYKWSQYLKRYFTPKRIVQRLFRKVIRRNTWIYVSVSFINIFVGIKERNNSYTFSSIWPLQHFHTFLKVLAERGVDMSKVKVNKAEATLWG
ncbi:hypothetical protein BDZ94DRAFT_1166419 [Collybia nuda]|uniref:Uncharacterized protein n=1 Tax=Collybia nuda TaxID=64659 RepID=A0A9P5Y4L3_9AGAR|nr:hypothetical protein BDZ94DRAFT_1166419 [Collybia nuda]